MMPLSSRRSRDSRHDRRPVETRLAPRPLSAAGDRRAIFLQRYARLLASARGLLGDRREQAQDLVHDAFVQFVLSQRPLDTIDDLDAYLYGMLRKLQLVRLRRAARHPVLSLADYDSLLVGLHVLDGSAYIHALHDLARIGHYACVRKESSSAASIFILRFFWGCSPPVVARLAHASPVVVAQRLRRARIEARVSIEAPQRLSFLHPRRPGDAPVDADAVVVPPIALDPTASIDEAHAQVLDAIVRSRRGACLTDEAIAALYAQAEPVPTTTLAHLVSCPACLDRAARHLAIDEKGGPAMGAHTHPHTTGPRPTAPPRGPRRDTPEQWLEAVSDHRPRELHVFANGFLVGSHRVGAVTSELVVSAHVDEPLSCVEILSEQGVLLLFLDVDPPFDGVADQHAGVAFGDGRTLGASLDFSSSWPLVRIHYEDPGWMMTPARATASPPAPASPTVAASPASTRRRSTRRSRWQRILDALGQLVPRFGGRTFGWHRLGWHRLGWHSLAWRAAIAVFVAWLAFGNGVPVIAAAAERLWHWVSTLTIGGERPPEVPRSPTRPSASVPPPPPIDAAPAIPAGTPAPAPTLPAHLSALTEPELIDLQVEVLARLDEVDGLSGDLVEVARENGGLHVSILAGRDDRARELRRALAPLAGRRGLVMRVRTADQINLPARSIGSRSLFRQYTVEGSRSAMQDDLRAHVVRTIDRPAAEMSADTIERAMQDTARTIVDTSHRALRHAWALQRLLDPFSPDSLAIASADTQALWRRLVDGHVAGYARELQDLTEALTFAAPSKVAPALDDATHDRATRHVEGRRLVRLAAEIDRAVQTSFRASTPGTTAVLPSGLPAGAVVKTDSFWRDIAEAQRLALRLSDH